MTIKIKAERIPQHELNLALDWFDAVIDKGFNGTYWRASDLNEGDVKIFSLNLDLSVDSMMLEIKNLRSILRDYISSFECTENTIVASQLTDVTDVADVADVEDAIEEEVKVEAEENQSTVEEEELVDVETEKQVNIPQKSVSDMFIWLNGNTVDEIATNAIHTLFEKNFKQQRTYDTFKDFIVIYSKAEKKPKSFNALCKMANRKVSPITLKKVNTVVNDKLGVETFMEFLKCMPNLAKNDENESEPEEVILEKPKKPPKKEKQEPSLIKCFPKHKEFDSFLKTVFASNRYRKYKVQNILNYMGLENLSKSEIKVINKICIKNLYMFNFYNPEQNYTEEEKIILESFVNNFAKSLKEDANFVSLKSFVKELSKIP